MATQANTIFKGNNLASDWHRILGGCCYYGDIDQTETENGFEEEQMKEYTYDSGKPRTVAMIDWKYPGKSLSDKHPSIQYQIFTSEQEYKIPIPFFMVVYYLDEQFPVKMYFVIPANIPARTIFDRCELSDQGKWMSVRTFSKFQHLLRDKPWNGDEQIKNVNLGKIGLPDNMKLKDLSSKVKEYNLPYRDFSWTGEKR